MTRLLLIIPLIFLLLACDEPRSPDPLPTTDWVEVEVIKEVTIEVPVEVIREVVVEVPVTPANCPPISEVDWLVRSLEDARAMHLAWADYLADYPPEEGTMLWRSVESTEAQLLKVAAYDRRLSIVGQLQQVCQ